MQSEETRKARERLAELAQDPAAARYLVGYLVGMVDEIHWPVLVEAALMYREAINELMGDRPAALDKLLRERFQ